ncbi:MAG TPA: DUF120 domain-containing protein [Candidatus Lokiarchaeia archaeon]|nr:DUF120 domain-containing protein [Candidatus Lokiarchaeia archaeon]
MRGLLIGRFQPFHLGHQRLVEKTLEIPGLEQLIIAIGEADCPQTRSNPFTYSQRATMLRQVLDGFISRDGPKISIIPLPYFAPPERFAAAILSHVGPVDLLVTNNDWVRAQFQAYPQIRVTPKLLFRRAKYRGGNVRSLIAQGDPTWKETVPPVVASYLENIEATRLLGQIPPASPVESNPLEEAQCNCEAFLGTVVSGTGAATWYVQVPHFYQATTDYLGTSPYLGTLNVKISESPDEFLKELRTRTPLSIPTQNDGGTEFWSVDCYPVILQTPPDGGQKAYALALDFGSQKEWGGVVELVAHPHLRTYLELEDQSLVSIHLLD